MKIECQSCGAAYKIADEKVQGKKVFKIKCKKCSSDIIVRGTDYAAEVQRPVEDEATRAMSTDVGDVIWHVVLNGEQQGPFSVAQVSEMLAQGNIDAETYVWRDGFEGWLPLQEVGELASVFGQAPSQEPEAPFVGNDLFASISPPAAEAPVAAPAPVFAPAFAPAPAPAPQAASDFYAAPEPSKTSSRPGGAEPAKARAKVGGGGGDLFATEARAQEASKPLFSNDEATVSTSGPSGGGGGDSMTGQRNENSVLFSLATLQQLSGPKETPASSSASSSGDSSGLIDINKLAGALSASPSSKSRSSVDDILTVGASGGLSSPLAAPVLAPVVVPAAAIVAPVAPPPPAPASKSMTGAIIAAAVIVTLGGLGAMALYLNRSEPPAAPVVASNTNTNTPPPAPTAQPESAPTPTAAPAPAAAPTAAPAPAPEAAPATPEARERERNRDRDRDRDRGSSNSAHAPSAPAAAPAAAPAPSAPSAPAAPARRPPTQGGSLDDLMGRVQNTTAPAARPAAAAAPAAPSATGVPDLPARPDVAAAMRGVGPAVRACGTGQGGTATVTVVFNSQGNVNTANVAPPAAGTPVGSCIARAVRGAHLPPFGRPTFSVTFPFALN